MGSGCGNLIANAWQLFLCHWEGAKRLGQSLFAKGHLRIPTPVELARNDNSCQDALRLSLNSPF